MVINEQLKSPFQLVATQVMDFSLKNPFIEIPADAEVKTTCEYDVEVFNKDSDKDILAGVVFLTVKVVVKSKDNDKLTASIKISGGFGQNGECDEEEFRKRLEVNGCASLYSFARAYLTQFISISTSISGKQIIIPLVNTFKLREKKNEETK